MKKLTKLLLLFSIVIASCDEVSISKEDLLTKSWILEETTLNGSIFNHEAIYLANSTYTFLTDGTVQIVTPQSSDIITGTWQLLNNNSELTIVFSGVLNEFVIEKLDNSNLWLSRIESNDVYLYKYSKLLLE